MKTVVWCPTRMGYILTSSKTCTELLVPLADVLASCDIKKENASYFLPPKCIAIMHILGDVEEVFMVKFIQQLDGDNSVIINVFHESENGVAALFNLFLDGLTEDDNGNIVLTTTATSDIGETTTHSPTLNYTNHPGKRPNGADHETKVEKIKRESLMLKEKILGNLKENIVDQNQSGTLVEFTSCFDMNRDLSCNERIELLKELHKIYFVDYVHEVEDQGQYGVAGWGVTIKCKAKIECSVDDLSNQFRALWPKMNKEWAAWKKSNNGHHINTKDFWKHMLEQYTYLATELFELINIAVSKSPGTVPLERSYSKLEMIYEKDRNNLGAR